MRQTVDLNDHMNKNVTHGNPADFPIEMTPAMYRNPKTGEISTYDRRKVVVRSDTGSAISVVSDQYTLVSHMTVIDTIEQAIAGLSVGPVPRGVYMEAGGARMRAIYKFPSLQRAIKVDALDRRHDELCPLIKISNTYDGSGIVSIEIGAFSFVCTNFSVGGSGVFAGGFMSMHVGEVALDEAARRLQLFLSRFDKIMDLFGHWSTVRALPEHHEAALAKLPKRYSDMLIAKRAPSSTVYDNYNVATRLFTHELGSARRALELLGNLNRGFQGIDAWMPKGETIEAEVIEPDAVLVG